MELEQCFIALMEIDKAISWLKTTDRPYLTIEAMMNSLEKKKERCIDECNRSLRNGRCILVIGVAITGPVLTAAVLYGAGKTGHAGINLYQTDQIKRSVEEIHKQVMQRMDLESQTTSAALQRLGEEKSLVLTAVSPDSWRLSEN